MPELACGIGVAVSWLVGSVASAIRTERRRERIGDAVDDARE